ncbi:MAG TPA: type III pantothenate kinase [Methylomirabilota bacterium]|jgi:type III pantothenate kinase|nr:type III pantothenate kinase [Methylomirabilota bacterium]
MLLVIDVGNTNTKLGVYDDRRLVASSRLTSRREQTADEYGVFTRSLLRARGIDPGAIAGVAISSTVPRVQGTLEEMASRYFGVSALVVEPGVNVPVPILVDYPREVGPDRVVKVVAGVELYRPPLIIVDFGTATVFDCVSPRGEFIGGAIAPGIAIATEALTSKAARLFRVDLTRPKEAIGRNTVTNVQSGIIYGYAGLVDGLVDRIRAEMEGTPMVVATGGLVSLMHHVARSIEVVNPDLTLEGLRLIWERWHGRAPGKA